MKDPDRAIATRVLTPENIARTAEELDMKEEDLWRAYHEAKAIGGDAIVLMEDPRTWWN